MASQPSPGVATPDTSAGQPGKAAVEALVTEGMTTGLRFEGWQGLGFLVGVRARGRVEGGRFRLLEQVEVSLRPRSIRNRGVTAVETSQGCFDVHFAGQVHGLLRLVEGTCQAEGTSGRYAGWRAAGTFTAEAGLRIRAVYRLAWEWSGAATAQTPQDT